MELYQIVQAVNKLPTRLVWLCIKSICDFGGLIEKGKEGQPLAAATAADFARFFLSIPRLLDTALLNSSDVSDVPRIRTNAAMLDEIRRYVAEIKSLRNDNEGALREFSYQSAYSEVCDDVSNFEKKSKADLMTKVNESMVRRYARSKETMRKLCREASSTEKPAVAIVSVAEEDHGIPAVMQLLKRYERSVKRYIRPDRRLLEQVVSGWYPRICLLVGSNGYNGATKTIWIAEATEERLSPQPRELTTDDVKRFVDAANPECVLLVADFSCSLVEDLHLGQLPQQARLIVWNEKFGGLSHLGFIDTFLESCLAHVAEDGFDCVAASYIRAMSAVTMNASRTTAALPIRLLNCPDEKRVLDRLETTVTPKAIYFCVRRLDLLKPTIRHDVTTNLAPKIERLLLSFVEEPYKTEVMIRFAGLVHTQDLQRLRIYIRDLKNLDVKMDYKVAGSIIFRCVVSDLNGLREWGRQIAANLESSRPRRASGASILGSSGRRRRHRPYRLPRPGQFTSEEVHRFFSSNRLRIKDISVTGLIVDTAAVRLLQRDPNSAGTIEAMCESDVCEERLFARLGRSDLTVAAIRRIAASMETTLEAAVSASEVVDTTEAQIDAADAGLEHQSGRPGVDAGDAADGDEEEEDEVEDIEDYEMVATDDLPEDWERYENEFGDWFYYNTETGETSSKKPAKAQHSFDVDTPATYEPPDALPMDSRPNPTPPTALVRKLADSLRPLSSQADVGGLSSQFVGSRS